MPYSSNSDLPESVRSRYSSHCQDVWRNVWNSVHEKTGDESRAFASANSQANKCQGSSKAMTPTFKIFAPMLKASMGPDGKMRLHGIASSTVKDRHGDTMAPSALADMERAANNNMTIFLNHEYRVPEDVAGSVERATIRSHPLDQDIHDLALDIVVNQSNERAVKAWEAINAGTQLGLSIGAMIPDGGAVRDRKSGTYQIDHVDLLETSLVGVPANPRSWVEYAVKSLNVSWADPDAPAGPSERSDGEVGVVIEYTEKDLEDIDPNSRIPREDLDAVIEGSDPELTEELVTALDEIEGEPATTEEKLEEILVDEGLEVVEMPEEAVVARLDATVGNTTTANTGYPVTTTTFPDVADATVSIETPFANISIDTGNRGSKPASDGASQEALASVPENEDTDEDDEKPNPWAAIGLTGEPEVEEVEPALQILEPTVVASLRTSSDLLKAITRELVETKKALDDAILERDAAIAATEKVLSNTAEILARLSATPVGRRASVRQVNEQFASLKSVYGEDFLTLLKKG